MFIFKKKGGVTKGQSYIHTTKLVDTGVYAIIRHPQYVALPLLNIAFILVGQHWIIAILGVSAIPLMLIDIQKADIAKFRGYLSNKYPNYDLIHNYPSGIFEPSEEDKKITKKLVEVGKLIDIEVFDQIIISRNGYFSFKENGLLNLNKEFSKVD